MTERVPAGGATPPAGRAGWRAWPLLGVAAGIFGLGAFIAVETAAIRVLPTYARVGPRAFPYLVAAGLILLGATLAWRAWRGLDQDPAAIDEGASEKLPMALVVGGLVLQSLLIGWLGFVLAAAITFVLTCAGFGSRHLLRDAAIGLALAAGSYVGFTRGLGLHLPAGILEGLL